MKNKYFLLAAFMSFALNAFAQWTTQTSGTTNFLPSICFPTIDTGYVIQDNGYVRKTVNGGANWNLIPGPINASIVYFTSSNTGFAVGSNGILKTTDGGSTWGDHLTYPVWTITGIHFPTKSIGYAVGDNTNADSLLVFKSTDTGLTWNLISKKQSSGAMPTIFFTDVLKGYLVEDDGHISKTSDGGITWVPQFFMGGSISLWSVNFSAQDTGYVVGDGGTILKTTDGGVNWNTQTNSNSDPLYSVFFTDSKHGWAVGGNGLSSGPILGTADAGVSWALSTNASSTFNSVQFPSSNIGYACGDNGTIMKFTGGAGGVHEVNGVSVINAYPNPNTGKFYVGVKGGVSIYNLFGEIIFEKNIKAVTEEIDLTSQPKGIYFVKVQAADKVYTEKVILQ
jgi:photosystem II stability/assembly factor-like uncharacterized protein